MLSITLTRVIQPSLPEIPTNIGSKSFHIYLRHGDGRDPLFRERVEADVAAMIDVWVEDSGLKLYFGRLERVGCGEGNKETEGAALKGRVWGAVDLHMPTEEVVAHLYHGAACGRIVQHYCQFLLDSLCCKLTHFTPGVEICNI